MTPIDLIFLYFCACAVSWGAYWMREWERRALDRKLAEQEAIIHLWEFLRRKLRENIREQLDYAFIMEFGKPIYSGPENWIPAKFCKNEYEINEVVNRHRIDGLWPKRSNPESNPTD